MPIIVKLVKLGSEIKEYEVSNDPTVRGLFLLAQETFNHENPPTRGGMNLTEYSPLHNDDRIHIGRRVKGNNEPFEVQIVRLGSSDGIINLPAEDGYTINQVLDQLPSEKKSQFFRVDGSPVYEYRVSGQGQGHSVDGSYSLSRPDSGTLRLILSTRTKGNMIIRFVKKIFGLK